jgi:ABC-type uncharacterized transport system substrate-binding protein
MFCPGSGTKQAQPAVRREVEMNKLKLGSFAVCAMLFALWLPAEAQQSKKVPRIGYLSSVDATTDFPRSEGIRLALREIGYIEGQNIVIERRYGEGKPDQAPQIASELVRLKVDLILVSGAGNCPRRPRMPPTRFPSL